MPEVDAGVRQKIISNNNLEARHREDEPSLSKVVHRPVPPVGGSGAPYVALRQEILATHVLARALLVVMTHLRQ